MVYNTSDGVLSGHVRYLKTDEERSDYNMKEYYDDFEEEFADVYKKKLTAEHIADIMGELNISYERALKTLKIPEEDYRDHTDLLNCFYPKVMKA